MTPRERAIAACEPFPVPRQMIVHFPNLIGRNAPGNDSTETHFTDEDLGEAIAMPASEAQLLHDIVLRASPFRLLEIGAYVGWSTAAMLEGLETWGGQILSVVDPFTESGCSATETEARFWENLDRVQPGGFTLVFRGRSPELLPIIKHRHGWDFAFIDGHHGGDQPLRDIQGLVPCLTDDAVVVLHDAWLAGVREAIDWLYAQGLACVELPTANKMTICYRDHRPTWLDDIEAKAREYVAVANG